MLSRLAALILLLAAASVAAAADQSPATCELQDVLQQLLTPVLQQVAVESQQPLQKQLQQIQLDQEQLQLGQQKLQSALLRLSDTVQSDHEELQALLNSSAARTGRQIEEPESACEQRPSPLSPDASPYQLPAIRACARSCLQLRNQATSQLEDGVYWLMGLPVPVFCDLSHDGGGWTLLLTAISKSGWDVLAALERSQYSPSLTDNYSILKHANGIRDLGHGSRFAYRIETQAETGRGQWGGVWVAPRSYSFVHESPSQTDVYMLRRFNKWVYQKKGVERRMPWLNLAVQSNHPAVLTTMSSGDWWGTLVTQEGKTAFDHSPWISLVAARSGTVLYWLREEVV